MTTQKILVIKTCHSLIKSPVLNHYIMGLTIILEMEGMLDRACLGAMSRAVQSLNSSLTNFKLIHDPVSVSEGQWKSLFSKLLCEQSHKMASPGDLYLH